MIEAKYGGRGAGPARGEGLSAVKPEEKREIEASICKMDSVDEFVTGTGWFTSHAGADKADLGATGKAEFGFDTECIAGSEVSELLLWASSMQLPLSQPLSFAMFTGSHGQHFP
jgi:hypothetical protein